MLGDQFTLNSLYTDEKMWLGNLGYSQPLGASGLRGQVSYAHTAYMLGKEFASADASGTAKTTTLGLTYPIIRSQSTNLNLSWSLQHKELYDEQGATNTHSEKSSNLLPLSLGFNQRDGLLGGGITYGSLTWAYGQLDLGATVIAQDQATARAQGSFNKLNLDLARIQVLPASFTLYGRVSGQAPSKNLDSSEKFGLGGAYGVRAYPSGEGFGDRGWLTQIELRYSLDAFTPYAFYDSGRVTINANPWAAGTNNRSLAGGGFGLRYQQGSWSMDALLAWRTVGGKPLSNTEDQRPIGWFNLGYKF
jgi:hemolysin activation/secretion protein